MYMGNKWLNIMSVHIKIGKNMKTLKYDIKFHLVNLAQFSINDVEANGTKQTIVVLKLFCWCCFISPLQIMTLIM